MSKNLTPPKAAAAVRHATGDARSSPEPVSAKGPRRNSHTSDGAPKARRRAAVKRVEDDAPAAPPTPAPAPRRRRSNRRSGQTIENIFAATEKVVLESGAERISILQVCENAGISRGTFYRYFASQDELLEGFSRHRREHFHRMAVALLESDEDPDRRFLALIHYLHDYLRAGSPRRLIVVAPEFALRFYKRIFHDSAIRFQVLLAPVFDVWDGRLGVKLDRELVCDLIIRFVMSEQIIDSEADLDEMPRRIGRLIDALRSGGLTRTRR
ncbi:bacterial regulatory s, tetR family protein [Paraburkholderia xenovorans LB400]|uniref:Transcriptional regulator, TetR family n=1 Tax=Paraburkholderia xenovorans (strain LB400) TaxID=266265 RepID=Q13HE8_PARXL|nr:TetR/AcrR family transcriptional regulator [Paraburkholderia xenovorans]ABE36491.1 transcriptional regulator, TetR family [Paraburkholderia xenovorans LB400]AIP34246.1 bacterial regulatory s, tetR family protein [Paraburkholderia xenovorans LB400]